MQWVISLYFVTLYYIYYQIDTVRASELLCKLYFSPTFFSAFPVEWLYVWYSPESFSTLQ